MRRTALPGILGGVGGITSGTLPPSTVLPEPQPFATPSVIVDKPGTTHSNINMLWVYQGELYFGYGDGGANTGPLAISAIDVVTGAESLKFDPFHTEQILGIEEMGGHLYMPIGDTRGDSSAGIGNNDGGYLTNAGGTWHEVIIPGEFIHTEQVRLVGDEIWVSGSKANSTPGTNDSNLVRSSDGGATWTVDVPPRAPADAQTVFGITSLLEAGGHVYIRPPQLGDDPSAWDPVEGWTTWVDGPRIATPPVRVVHDGLTITTDGAFGPGKTFYPSVSVAGTVEPLRSQAGRLFGVEYVYEESLAYLCESPGVVGGSITWTRLAELPYALGPYAVDGDRVFYGGDGSIEVIVAPTGLLTDPA